MIRSYSSAGPKWHHREEGPHSDRRVSRAAAALTVSREAGRHHTQSALTGIHALDLLPRIKVYLPTMLRAVDCFARDILIESTFDFDATGIAHHAL